MPIAMPMGPKFGLTAALVVTSVMWLSACQPSDQPSSGDSATAESSSPAVSSATPALPRFEDAAKPDSGPPLVIVRERGAMLLTVDARDGDQINALLPPYLETTNGRRLEFGGSAVTADSAYFAGAVTARVADSLLPLTGTLHTSYCRAGERLCRSAKRAVRIDPSIAP